jgi:hypothetical protein
MSKQFYGLMLKKQPIKIIEKKNSRIVDVIKI